MNILYIDGGNVLHEDYMYPYYGGVYRELTKQANVYLYNGFVGNIFDILSKIDAKIDCIIYGLGYFAQGKPSLYGKIYGLDQVDIPVMCMIHKPQSLISEKLQFCKINKIDLLIDSQSTFKRFGEIAGVRSIRLPFTATPKYFFPRNNIEKKYDIGFSGALHGSGKINGPTRDLRTRVKNILDERDKYNVFWNGSDSVHTRINSVEEYAAKINECKIWLSTTGPMLDVGPRYFEVVLSKTLLFCNEMPEENGEYFKDGVTCVTFRNDLSDFEKKLDYYLKNDEERNMIIERSYELFLNNFTWKHMADNLIKEIGEIKSARKEI